MEPDRWPEERSRGLSIDLGYVWTHLEDPGAIQRSPVAFIDVPGHADYLTNMLAGVGAADHAIFVVAADDGWAAQSEEHLEILQLLDVEVLAAAITKSDLVDAGRVAEVSEEVARRLAASGRGGPEIVPVSSLHGSGVEQLRSVLARRLAASQRGGPLEGRPARLWIDRSFRIRGAGSVVTGTLQHGALTVGQDVLVLPTGAVGHVRGLQQLGESVQRAEAGGRVAVDLGRMPHDDLARGGAIVARGQHPTGRATRVIDIHVDALAGAGIRATGSWHLHLGTGFSVASVRPIFGEIEPGGSGVLRLELDRDITAWTGDRFVLRDSGRQRTAGGGVVVDPHPRALPRGSEARFDRALALEEIARADSLSDQIVALVDSYEGIRPLRTIENALATVIPPVIGLRRVGEHLVRSDLVDAWVDAMLAEAACAPAEHAVDLSSLSQSLMAAGCDATMVRAIVGLAVDAGGLTNFGGRVVHRNNVARYLVERDSRQQRLILLLDEHPLEPPDPGEAIAAVGLPSFEVQELIDDGRVVLCGPLMFTRSAIEEAVSRLLAGPASDGSPFSASAARQAWGTTRRCAVPLLERLHATGITVFDGSEHQLRPESPWHK